jgi:senataxin
VQGQHQSAPKGHSLINLAEIEVALQLYERLTTDYGVDFDFKSKIGIITPYKSQLAALRQRFTGQYGQMISDTVEFNTTDAFQGRECDIIIFSCVRASPAGNIGFLRDIRRMNVGLTRAKSSLWVLGNSDSLMRGEFWGKLIEDSKTRDRFSRGNYMQELSRPNRREPRRAPLPIAAPAAKVSIKEEPPIQGMKRKASTDIVMLDSAESFIKQQKTEPKPQPIEYPLEPPSKPSPSGYTPSNGYEDEEEKDIEMEDISSVKDEVNPESIIEKPAPKPAPSRPAIFGGRPPPSVIPKKKIKRAPANPLVQPNRPKKPKPQ